MKRFIGSFVVTRDQIDEGNHMSWFEQLKEASRQHFLLRDKLGLDLEGLKRSYDLYLVMRTISNVTYFHQLRLNDEVEVEIRVNVSSTTQLGFGCEFKMDGKVVTCFKWDMPLIQFSTSKPARIPFWIKEITEG